MVHWRSVLKWRLTLTLLKQRLTLTPLKRRLPLTLTLTLTLTLKLKLKLTRVGISGPTHDCRSVGDPCFDAIKLETDMSDPLTCGALALERGPPSGYRRAHA